VTDPEIAVQAHVPGPIYRLVLHPQVADYAPASWAEIIQSLQATAFLGEAYPVDKKKRYYIGDKFLQMITFMGCSPHIEIEPRESGALDFCHIVFSDIPSKVLFRHHERDVYARCPECGRRDSNWPEFIDAWSEQPAKDYLCPNCESRMSPYAIGWRNSAGFARLFIDILSVHPHEAVPTEQLLLLLKKITGQDWVYFYCHA